MRCAQCQTDNREGRRFCAKCGSALPVSCPSCAFSNEPDEDFCGGCGRVLEPVVAAPSPQFASPESYTPRHLAEKILTSRSALEGERKQVTVLFCDIVDSTALAERIGAEAMHGLLNRFFELALGEVHRYEGTINQFLGDGFMALFGAPIAHEDHPMRAILAALAIQRCVRDHWSRGTHHVQPALRMGLNTGTVVVGSIGDNLRMDYTAVGDTTHLAARLQQLADPDTVVISEAMHRLVEAYVESSFLGEHELKGLGSRPLYRLETVKPDAVRFDVALQRGLTPLIGRERELEELKQRYHEARAGQTRVVNLAGEAGLGKSRLLYELRHQLPAEQAVFLEGHCTSYGRSTAFLPFIEVIRLAFRLGPGDSGAEIDQKLRRGLELLGLKEENVPYLLNLLGLDPATDAFQGLDGEIIGARTRDTLEELLRARCRLSPTILALDDLHWSDRPSEELLLRVIRSAERLPLLILCAFRPEYRPPWTRHENVTELLLQPLSDESCVQLVQRRLGTEALPRESTQLIVGKSEGNPLFAEELIRYLVGTGSLVRTADSVAFRPASPNVVVPDTVRDLIMARVDRLSEGHRAVLQVASAIGRRFSSELVRAVAGVNGNPARYFSDLEAQELIFRQGVGEQAEYVFKHALIQEAIYESLLTPRREVLHRRLAEAIEQSHADRLGEWAEVLAHHWSQTAQIDKSVRYLSMAGEKSLRVYSVEEAHERFRRVVELVEGHPDRVDGGFLADVLLNWARAYYYRKDFKGLIAAIEPYLGRVEALGDRRRLSLLLFWLGFAHLFGARFDAAMPLLEKALRLGEAIQDDECVGYASMGLAWVYGFQHGERHVDMVNRLAERTLSITAASNDVYLASKCLLGLAFHRLAIGRHEEARGFGERILELGKRMADPRTVAMGLYSIAWVNAFGRFEEAIEQADEAFRLSPDPADRLTALAAKGIALALMGRGQDGLATLREVRAALLAGDFLLPLIGTDVPYGAAMVIAGEMSNGVRWIENCIRRFEAEGDASQPALGHLVLGEIYLQVAFGKEKPPRAVILKNLGFILRTGPFAARKARHHLEEGVRRARQAGLPYSIARGLLGLGLLCKAKKRWEEARRHLEEARHIAEPHSSPLTEKIGQALASLR